jgi:hypothetical protein
MGVSILYMSVPSVFANTVRDDEGLKDVFITIYGYGSGTDNFFSEIDQDEIDEITEGLPKQDISRLKELIKKTDFGEEAHIEKTYDVHVAGLEKYFKNNGMPEPEKMANLIIGGDKYKLGESILGFDASEAEQISSLLSGKYSEIISCYTFEVPYSDNPWKEVITTELKRIIECYESANKIKGEVWIGFL